MSCLVTGASSDTKALMLLLPLPLSILLLLLGTGYWVVVLLLLVLVLVDISICIRSIGIAMSSVDTITALWGCVSNAKLVVEGYAWSILTWPRQVISYILT